MPRWTVQHDWVGETVVGIAGGESVKQVDFSVLQGRKVVVVNSSYTVAPNADWLVFTDIRWWKKHRHAVRANFKGRVLTLTPDSKMYGPDVHVVIRQRSSGISTDPTRIACWHTTVAAANNFIGLTGAAKLGWLGLDGGGNWHHEPHPENWKRHSEWAKHHGDALTRQVEPLKAMGLEVFNLNPNSKFQMFPFSTLEEFLA
jgi:hypothetical protein